MEHFEIRSRVGADGTLALNVPLGPAEANREVLVSVDTLSEPAERSTAEWRQFIEATAGKWQGEPLERPPQGAFETRMDWA